MTKKKTKKGQPAPQSKHPEEQKITKAGQYAGSVVVYTLRFAVIWMCAVALGLLVHWTDVHCEFIEDSMIHTGHDVEKMLYLLDFALLIWSVTMHTIHAAIGDWKAMRHSADKK